MTGRPGRNDPCWCGSGKKFKYCHLRREQDKPLPSEALTAEARRFFRIKQCLHPLASTQTCGKLIGAHTIQRRGVLQEVVDKSGHVLSFYPPHSTQRQRPHKVGWREASTFSGFCQRHDNETFRSLEQSAFVGSDEQCFLLAYRAQCHELYQKQAAHRSHEPLRHLLDRGMPPEHQYVIQAIHGVSGAGVQQGLDDARKHKERMDTELLDGHYGNWRRLFVRFKGPMCVVSTGAPTPNRNFIGDELQRLHDRTSRLQPLYFGPIKTKEGGVWIFLWRPEDDAPQRFLEDFRQLPREQLPGMLTQFMFAYVENTFFAADWWAGLNDSVQDHLGALARMANAYYGDWQYLPGVFMPWHVTTVESQYSAT